MNPAQKRIVIVLGVATALVFAAVAIAALSGPSDRPEATGTSVAPTTSTSSTTTALPATSEPAGTSTSTTTTSTTTSTTTATEPPVLTLREDGLGEVPFGTEVEGAIARLGEILGPADDDTGWGPSFSGFGACPGERVRGVRWGTLWALFADGRTEWGSAAAPHFFAYLNSVFFDESRSLGLLTEEGIGLGDSVASLEAAYESRLTISFEELVGGHVFIIEVAEPGVLSGALTGDGETDLITAIDGGRGCGE